MGLDWIVQRTADGTRPSETAKCATIGPETREQYRQFFLFYGYCTDAEFEKRYGGDVGLKFPSAGFAGIAPVAAPLGTPFDYRGAVIAEMSWLGKDVTAAAYEPFSPEEMTDYADDLEARLGEAEGKDRTNLEGAIKWLRFWAEAGHGIEPWY